MSYLANLFRKILSRGIPTRYPCPCCGYPTLSTPAAELQVCNLCNWETGDADPAGEGNRPDLKTAQANFLQFQVIFSPDEDPRVGGGDNARERTARAALIRSFGDLRDATPSRKRSLWATIVANEEILAEEMDKKIMHKR